MFVCLFVFRASVAHEVEVRSLAPPNIILVFLDEVLTFKLPLVHQLTCACVIGQNCLKVSNKVLYECG